MTDWRRYILLPAAALLALAGAIAAAPSMMNGSGNGERDMLLYVDSKPAPWYDTRLQDQLIRAFTRKENVRITPVDTASERPPAFPKAVYDLDSLTNWGLEAGGRYLVLVVVDDSRLETKKKFHLPLVFHKYETVGIIEGELRVIDLDRRRQLIAEPFRVEKAGPRIFQATMDDDVNDPDLRVAAKDKQTFFDDLESKLANRIVKRVGTVIRIR